MKNKKHIVFLLICSFSFILLFFGCKNSTEDSSSVTKVEGKSYVPGTLPGTFGNIVADRMVNKTSAYDSDCENFFLTADSIDSMDESDWNNFMKHLLNGKTVVFVAPTYSTLRDIDASFRIVANYTDEQFKKLLEDIDVFSENAYSYICQVADETSSFLSSSVEDKGDTPVYEIVAIHGSEIYYIENVDEAAKSFGKELNADISATEDMYNLFVPDFIDWLNTTKSETDSETTERAVISSSRSVSENSDENDYTFSTFNTVSHIITNYLVYAPCGFGDMTAIEESGQTGLFTEWVRQNTAFMHVKIITNYWFVSKQTNEDSENPEYNDYLVFEQEVNYFNNELACNVDKDENCWYDKYGYRYIYGPYFRRASITNTLVGETPIVEKALPHTDILKTTYTKGVDFSISGNLSLSKDGFSPGLSAGLSFTNSESKEVLDLGTVYNCINNETTPQWTFNGNVPKFEAGFFRDTHKTAPDSLISSMTVQPSWYWEIENADKDKDQYILEIDSSTTVELLTRYLKYFDLYDNGEEDMHIKHTNSKKEIHYLPAPYRNKTTINVNLDWTGIKNEKTGEMENTREDASIVELDAIESLLQQNVASYYQTYRVFTKNNSKPSIEKQVSKISQDMQQAVTKQKNTLKRKNFYKYGVMTFEFRDQDDNLIASFPIDFSK